MPPDASRELGVEAIELLEDPWLLAGGMPRPGVGDGEPQTKMSSLVIRTRIRRRPAST